MTPPVVHDPSLRVPATDVLIVGGVALLATVAAAGAHSLLISGDDDFIYSPGAMCLVIFTYLAMGAAAIWAARRTGNARRALGLVAPRSWPRAIGLAFGTVVLALIASALLEPIFHGADAQDVVPEEGRPPGIGPILGVILAYTAVAIVGPVVEELIFRGLLTAAMRRRFGSGAHRPAHLAALRRRPLHSTRDARGVPARSRARIRVRAGQQHGAGSANSLLVQRSCPHGGGHDAVRRDALPSRR